MCRFGRAQRIKYEGRGKKRCGEERTQGPRGEVKGNWNPETQIVFFIFFLLFFFSSRRLLIEPSAQYGVYNYCSVHKPYQDRVKDNCTSYILGRRPQLPNTCLRTKLIRVMERLRLTETIPTVKYLHSVSQLCVLESRADIPYRCQLTRKGEGTE